MTTLTEWVIFNVAMIVLIAIDLGAFSRKAHVIHVREAMIRSVVWIALAFLFAAYIGATRSNNAALRYISGYVTEESLSVDNLFVMLIIFSYFQVPRHYQHKVLVWGIFGALVLRALFIVLGVSLLEWTRWSKYVFGAILVYTAIKLLVSEEQYDPQKNLFLRFARRYLPITDHYVKDHFFTRAGGKLMMTPLFVVLWVVDTTDLLFAVDSVPAVLGVVPPPALPHGADPALVAARASEIRFLAYTSNAFAIVGLRSLYFALAGMLDAFHFLRFGLSAILAFVGVKMLIEDFYPMPNFVVLAVVGGCLILSIGASLVFKKKLAPEADKDVGSPEERVETAP